MFNAKKIVYIRFGHCKNKLCTMYILMDHALKWSDTIVHKKVTSYHLSTGWLPSLVLTL